MKTEDGLFEERNNLLREIREELYDLRKECDDRVHILLRANVAARPLSATTAVPIVIR